jgi:Na+-driven multidrug efflux pump
MLIEPVYILVYCTGAPCKYVISVKSIFFNFNIESGDYIKECWNIYQGSVPVFLGSIVQRMIAYSSLFFVGQYLGKYEMAAASLSNMFATITGWSLAQSMTNVCTYWGSLVEY